MSWGARRKRLDSHLNSVLRGDRRRIGQGISKSLGLRSLELGGIDILICFSQPRATQCVLVPIKG
jgi:hypothetical protein